MGISHIYVKENSHKETSFGLLSSQLQNKVTKPASAFYHPKQKLQNKVTKPASAFYPQPFFFYFKKHKYKLIYI